MSGEEKLLFLVKWFKECHRLPSGLCNVKRGVFDDKQTWLAAEDVDCQVFFGKKLNSDWLHVFEHRSFAHIPSWWLSEDFADS